MIENVPADESAYTSPALEFGEQIRRLSSLRRWPEVDAFYRILLRRRRVCAVNALTGLTINVWDHPERYR